MTELVGSVGRRRATRECAPGDQLCLRWLERTPDKREVGSSTLPRPTPNAASTSLLCGVCRFRPWCPFVVSVTGSPVRDAFGAASERTTHRVLIGALPPRRNGNEQPRVNASGRRFAILRATEYFERCRLSRSPLRGLKKGARGEGPVLRLAPSVVERSHFRPPRPLTLLRGSCA